MVVFHHQLNVEEHKKEREAEDELGAWVEGVNGP